jgi:hypothetical protein
MGSNLSSKASRFVSKVGASWFRGLYRGYGKISRPMQFLRASGPTLVPTGLLSTPFLNELQLLEFGRGNARKDRFGALTQANWQGDPSRGSVWHF